MFSGVEHREHPRQHMLSCVARTIYCLVCGDLKLDPFGLTGRAVTYSFFCPPHHQLAWPGPDLPAGLVGQEYRTPRPSSATLLPYGNDVLTAHVRGSSGDAHGLRLAGWMELNGLRHRYQLTDTGRNYTKQRAR